MIKLEGPGMDANKIEEERAGMFQDMEGPLAERWKKFSVEDQDTIANALAEITGDGPGIVGVISEEKAGRFIEHLRTYLSPNSSGDLKEAAADAIRRAVSDEGITE
ncbi:MAG TPA: hypothetical protein VGE62_01270 [Candidatus Paceibacterota bacterium]